MSMMMTDTELEVGFILWEAEDPFDRPCEATRIDCPNVAMYRMLWVPSKDQTITRVFGSCKCGSQSLCLGCKDFVLAQEFRGIKSYRCRKCDGACELKGIEPIRGTA